MHAICVGEAEPVSSIYSRPNRIQSSVLEQSFAACRFPDKPMLKKLALQTGLNQQKIINWFGYRRQKARKEKCGKYYVCSYM